MSKDIIYREDAIKAVKNVSKNYTKEGDREWHPHIDFITQALVEVPSIPSEDRPQEKWIYNSALYALGNPHYDCSCCGESVEERTNFCPNCGARMKGTDDEM